METQKQTRRRGEKLENAILTAAWDQLNKVGYKDLTITEIASLAGTNKTTIYRRWPNKSLLVVSAFSKFVPKPKMQIPNSGNLRDDLVKLFEQLVNQLEFLTSGKFEGLLLDRLRDTSIDKVFERADENNALQKFIVIILQRAEKRGELKINQLSQRVLELPFLLLLNEVISTRGIVPKESLTEIVDQILLPVFLRSN
ncbi:putative transcriptional regulator [Oenococcus oeni]|uniref:TetR/AcrR family transcriptional regulator n=1 Tax=Oenococcus oeni TaxID=1247 RepID=UPI0010B7881B|nr:TetR/AcrR family transcriptional regulator [Oenococcus oeni]SYW00407.1 putative transcriptional regulator [Oenococcus oeni]